MATYSKDYLYELFQRPSRESFREYFQNSTGEMNDIDFKSKLEINSKLAKHMLGIANYGGGAIIFGVKQDNDGGLDYIGVDNIVDKADIDKKLNIFIPSDLDYEVHEFIFESAEYIKLQNKKFQMILIPDMPNNVPFFSKKDGEEIKKDDIYYRQGTSTIKADATQIRKILTRMIKSQTTDSSLTLEQHFNQLKTMFALIDKDKQVLVPSYGILGAVSLLGSTFEQVYGKREYQTVVNEYYPAENFEEFVSRCIQTKKNKIKAVLEII